MPDLVAMHDVLGRGPRCRTRSILLASFGSSFARKKIGLLVPRGRSRLKSSQSLLQISLSRMSVRNYVFFDSPLAWERRFYLVTTTSSLPSTSLSFNLTSPSPGSLIFLATKFAAMGNSRPPRSMSTARWIVLGRPRSIR